MLKTDITEGIATVSIDQDGQRMNLLSTALAVALDREFARLSADPAVTGIILTSGKATFVAGADLTEVTQLIERREVAELAVLGQQIRRMETCGKPVVAALPGTALGGGLELALGCHYRIAADAPGAVYGLPEVGLGLLPGAGGTQRLPRIVGLEPALRMLTDGKPIAADQAKAIGLIDDVVTTEGLMSAARAVLAEGRVPAQQPWDMRGFRMPGTPVSSIEAFTAFLMANAAATAHAGHFQPAAGTILSAVFEGIRLPIERALAVEAGYFAKLAATHAARGLTEARFFLRQRIAKRGPNVTAVDNPELTAIAAKVTQAMQQEAARIAAEGQGANVVRNAAIRAGLPPLVPPAQPAAQVPDGEPGDAAMLDRIAHRLLDAGAAAVADVPDADLAALASIDLAGYPEWTGGPALWRATAVH